VCAAVSPTLVLVMYETQLTAYNGKDFAPFETRLRARPAVQQQYMIMVMDNVGVHFTQEVQGTMAGQAIQHTVERLPVCPPHLNPIEYCFHNWKTEIKHVDQLHDRRPLLRQVEDTRTVVTDHLVGRILDHVYQLYAHCIQELPLEDVVPIGHRVARAQDEAALQRAVIAAGAEEKEVKEN
jgi:transposase